LTHQRGQKEHYMSRYEETKPTPIDGDDDLDEYGNKRNKDEHG
jgi:hypothetical protein